MTNFSQIFIYLLIVQMFYAFTVSIFVPLIPDAQQQQIISYTDEAGVISFVTLGNQVEGSVGKQTTTSFVDIGALIFYSTSLVINLIVNFFTAIPQMISWVLVSLFVFIPVEETIQITVKTIFTAMATIIYWILLILFIMGARTSAIR